MLQDHNSKYSVSLVEKSNLHCISMGKPDSYTKDQLKATEEYQKIGKYPCHIAVMKAELSVALKNGTTNLWQDGFKADIDIVDESVFTPTQIAEPRTKVGKAVKAVACIMRKVEHGLFDGSVYCKAAGGN